VATDAEDIKTKIDGLPKSLGGGLKRGAVEDLLRQVQADYARLSGELQKLKETVERDQPPAVPRREPDELARLVLAAAHKSAVEIRESARLEAEAVLHKARARASEIEHDYANVKAAADTELAKVADQVRTMRDQLQALLAAVEGAPAPANGAVSVDQALFDVAAAQDS
jgi:DivIVA protein